MGLARETSSAPKAKNCVHPSIDNRGGSTIHNIITSVCTSYVYCTILSYSYNEGGGDDGHMTSASQLV